MQWKLVAALAAGISLAALTANALPTELSATQIVDKNAAARGGVDAWRKIQTMVWTGVLQSSHAEVPSMLFVMQQERPNKSRFDIDALGQKTVRIFDGTRGWTAKPGPGGRDDIEPFSAEAVAFARSGQVIDGQLIDYQAKGNLVRLEGIDQIRGHAAYRLGVHLSTGEVDHVWIDTQSFLDLRYDRPFTSAAGTTTVSVFYGNYKTVQGLKIPYLIETGGVKGMPPDKMVIEKVMLNAPVDARTFARPGTPLPRGGVMRRAALPRAISPTRTTPGPVTGQP